MNIQTEKRKPLSVLFVCTANICRSPMAEGIMKRLVSTNELKGKLKVESAGVAAIDGEEASLLAQEVSREAGIDITRHRSQPVTKKLLKHSDLVLTMTLSHQHEIERVYPEYAEKTFRLREYGLKGQLNSHLEIDDPYGGSRENYEICFLTLRREVERILPEIEKEIMENGSS